MKVKVIQPPYPVDVGNTSESIGFMVRELNSTDESVDLVLLPECCNAPSGCASEAELRKLAADNTAVLTDAASSVAKRCHAVVGINLYIESESLRGKFRNTTILFAPDGSIAAKYDKLHLSPAECANSAIDRSYVEGAVSPTFCVIDGVKYSFMTCYDVYYAEMMGRIAAGKPDIILISTLQRGERADILETQVKSCAFLCNSHVVRSSYYMGEDCATGANSMVASSDGRIIRNFEKGCGSFVCEIGDPHIKYMRPNGFGRPPVPNDVFQNSGRVPGAYRAAGTPVTFGNSRLHYPRICSRVSEAAPRDTLQAAALSVCSEAEETYLDVAVAGGVPVVCPDDVLGDSLSFEDFAALRPGIEFGAAYASVTYSRLEEYFRKFQCMTVFCLHLSEKCKFVESDVAAIIGLLSEYDMTDHVYVSSSDVEILKAFGKMEPGISLCREFPGVDISGNKLAECSEFGFDKVMVDECFFTAATARLIRNAGIRCVVRELKTPEKRDAAVASGADSVIVSYMRLVPADRR